MIAKDSLFTHDDEGAQVEIMLTALVANNSANTVISERLARRLFIRPVRDVNVSCLLFGTTYNLSFPSKFVDVFDNAIGKHIFLSPLINRNNAFYEIILGREYYNFLKYHSDVGRRIQLDDEEAPTPGPGYTVGSHFRSHNISIPKDVGIELRCLSCVYNLKFDGASRGNPGHSGGAFHLWRRDSCSSECECIWSDSYYFGHDKTSNQAEYLALIVGK